MITVIEEGFLTCCVIWNITISSLRVIRVAWVIPAYRWTRVGIRCGVGAWSLNLFPYAILLYNECLQNKYLDDYYKMAIFPPLNAVGLFEKHESLFWLRDTFYHSPTNK